MPRSLTLIVLVSLTACGTARSADAGTPASRERMTASQATGTPSAGADTIPAHPRSATTERFEFSGGNSTREHRLQLPADAEGATFRSTFRVDEGTVIWFLFDPAGEIRWSGRKDAGGEPDEIRGDVDGPAGDWKLVIDMRHADGLYTLDWEPRRAGR